MGKMLTLPIPKYPVTVWFAQLSGVGVGVAELDVEETLVRVLEWFHVEIELRVKVLESELGGLVVGTGQSVQVAGFGVGAGAEWEFDCHACDGGCHDPYDWGDPWEFPD